MIDIGPPLILWYKLRCDNLLRLRTRCREQARDQVDGWRGEVNHNQSLGLGLPSILYQFCKSIFAGLTASDIMITSKDNRV